MPPRLHAVRGVQTVTMVKFFRDEQAVLKPFQSGLFDDLIGG